jgi:hypothetical protein
MKNDTVVQSMQFPYNSHMLFALWFTGNDRRRPSLLKRKPGAGVGLFNMTPSPASRLENYLLRLALASARKIAFSLT